MQTISGPLVDTGDVLTSDVITADFSTLADALAAFATQTCGGTITTTKLIDADGDPATTHDQTPAQNWTFDVNGNPSNPAATQTDDNGQTPAVPVSPGTYSVNETPQTGYQLMSASCNTTNGPNGSVVNGTPSIPGNNVTGIIVTANNIVTCTFINSPVQPTLTLVKTVTNNNGGSATAANFQAKIDGYDVAWSTAITLTPGQHTASETGLSTYTAGNWGQDCATNGTITLALGQNKTCTITNDDNKPSLTLVKTLGETYGSGAEVSEWVLTAIGASQDPTNLSGQTGTQGATSGTDFKADTYTLGETGPSGFTSSWECVGGDALISQSIAISLGQNVTCTVTNTGVQPKITLVKAIYGTSTAIPLRPIASV